MNILSGWNLIFGVNSLLYFTVDKFPCLLKVFSHLLLVSASKSLRLIQKYWLLLLVIVSKSHLKHFFLVISNIFIYSKKKSINFFIASNFFYFILSNFIIFCFICSFLSFIFYFIFSYLSFSFKIVINSL